MKKIIPLILLVVSGINCLSAQQNNSPYQLRPGPDIPVTIATTGLSIGGYLMQKSVSPLTAADLAGLNRLNINTFDRKTSHNWNPRVAKVSDWILIGATVLPAALIGLKPVRRDFNEILILGTQTYTLTSGLTLIAKATVRRNRPFTYIQNLPADEVLRNRQLEADARFSFFSGHTSMTAASGFFIAKVYSDYYPDSGAKPWIWAGAITLPAIVGIMRIRSGKHFPTDVITGYAVGALSGILIPALHRRR